MLQPNYNQFQNGMALKFDKDIYSMSASMPYVRGRESLVNNYITDIASLFQPAFHNISGNSFWLRADYDTFKKHFVRYWRNALGLSIEDSEKLKAIFDEEILAYEKAMKRVTASVFFEDDKAITVDDCLNAVYEVLRMV